MYLPKCWFYPELCRGRGMTVEFTPMNINMSETSAMLNPLTHSVSEMSIEMSTVSASHSQISVGISSESVSNP